MRQQSGACSTQKPYLILFILAVSFLFDYFSTFREHLSEFKF